MNKARLTIKSVFFAALLFSFCTPSSGKQSPMTNKNGKQIEIIIPPSGSIISSKKAKTGGKVDLIVKGNSLNLTKGEYITLLIRKSGEDVWQRISSSTKIESNYTGLWTIDAHAAIKKNFTEGELRAIVTEKPITTDAVSASADTVSIPFMCISPLGHILKTE